VLTVRYSHPKAVGYQGSIEPEDSSWVVFVDNQGEPTLWRRVETTTADGKTDSFYADVEAITGELAVQTIAACSKDQGCTSK